MIPSFPLVYLGTLLAVFLYNPRVADTLPTWKQHLNSTALPSPTSLPLVIFSLLVLQPLLAQWRAALKRVVFAPIAKHWAGLEPGSLNHDKFLEQAWLAVHCKRARL